MAKFDHYIMSRIRNMATCSIFVTLVYVYSSAGYILNNYENEVHVTHNWDYPQTEDTEQIQVTESKTVASPSMPDKSDEFAVIYNNYRNLLLSDDFDKSNNALVKYTKALSKSAESSYKKIDQSPDRKILWPEKLTKNPSYDLNTQFQILKKLTLAYGTNGTIFYKSEDMLFKVKDCLEFLVSPGRYDGKARYGNWWNWQVGIPTNFLDILVIIKNKLTVEKLDQYTDIISTYVPDIYHKLNSTPDNENEKYQIKFSNYRVSSSQKMELGRVVLGLGILQKDEAKICETLDGIVGIMEPVTKLDGFYIDGSYIEHYHIPYTGSYGNELVKKMGDILEIARSTQFENPDTVKPIVECVERAFLPLIYLGEMIAPVRGRQVSREPLTPQIGSHAMYTLLAVATFASAENKKKIKESVKYWMKQNKNYYFTSARTYNELKLTIDLLKDTAIVGNKLPFTGAKMYASMDRFIQQTSSYTLGLSLYSKRISAFEAGNAENKRGWHTADGAMYLYNYDGVQFRDDYWPTIDPYRLPGTTVDTIDLSDELEKKWESFLSTEKWVGGVASGSQAVVGMALNKKGFKNNGKISSMDLKGKKSWFIVDGQIVALGAGITGTTIASIETIVDNRLLNDKYKYEVWSNYDQIKADKKNVSVNWLLLQSSSQSSSIGYYFPNHEKVDVIFETRYGTYKDINNAYYNKSIKHKGSYRKFIINHGRRPVEADYAYVVLPGIQKNELEEYADSKFVNILENSAEIQAVEINGDYLGINIWSELGGKIEGISTNKSISLMRQTNGFQQKYVLTDPTQSDSVITIKIPDFSKVLTMSEGIEYDDINNLFYIDFSEAAGASKQITVDVIKDTTRSETIELK